MSARDPGRVHQWAQRPTDADATRGKVDPRAAWNAVERLASFDRALACDLAISDDDTLAPPATSRWAWDGDVATCDGREVGRVEVSRDYPGRWHAETRAWYDDLNTKEEARAAVDAQLRAELP